MSVVVGVVEDGKVYMGSDSGATGNVQYISGSKVFQKGKVLYGVVGTVESCNAIQFCSKLPGSVINMRSGGEIREDIDLHHWAYHSILSRVKEGLKKAEVSEPSFTLLVGIEGRLLIVEENAVYEDSRPYAAIGSAEQVALGALFAQYSRQGLRKTGDKIVGLAVIFTVEDDGIAQDWEPDKAGLIYVNPPYGRELKFWVEKCVSESVKRPFLRQHSLNSEIILLMPARTDTSYWHHGVLGHADAICYLRGRLRFKGANASAPFPSALVYFGDRPNGFRDHFRGIGHVHLPV